MNLIEIDKKVRASSIAKSIRAINGSPDKNTAHSYLPLYDKLLKRIKSSAENVLEIGVHVGGSMNLWEQYFEKATVYGCDIVDRVNESYPQTKNKERIVLLIGESAYSKQYIDKNFKDVKFDFILDDGPHTLKSQIDFIKLYTPLMTENGILIIEDVQDIKFLDEFIKNTPENLKQYIKTYDLRKNKNRYDDIVFTIDKS